MALTPGKDIALQVSGVSISVGGHSVRLSYNDENFTRETSYICNS